MPATYEPIASTTLGSDASSITFSDIPGTYTDLILVLSGSLTANDKTIKCQINADTGSNYSHTNVLGYSGGAISQRDQSTSWNIGNNWVTAQSSLVAHFMSYANTSVYKTTLSAEAAGTSVTTRVVGLWRSTSAITSIKLFPSTNSFASGTTASLYGIKAA
jgi:hypothetical protein